MSRFSDRSKFIKKFYGKDLFDDDQGGMDLFSSMISLLKHFETRDKFEVFVQSLFRGRDGGDIGGPEHFNDIRQPTESQAAQNKSGTPAFQLMHIYLAKTLGRDEGNQEFKCAWMGAFHEGFDKLIKEMEDKGPDHFIYKDANDPNFAAGKGGLFWDGIIKYIKHIGSAGLKNLMYKIGDLPENVKDEEIIEKRLLWL